MVLKLYYCKYITTSNMVTMSCSFSLFVVFVCHSFNLFVRVAGRPAAPFHLTASCRGPARDTLPLCGFWFFIQSSIQSEFTSRY